MPTVFDIRELNPQVQRAVEGVVQSKWQLADDEVKDLVADAMSKVLLFNGSVFGSQLIVTDRDGTTQAPTEYATSAQLTPPQATVISSQAALDYFYHRFGGIKTSEQMADEASSWEYSLSPNLLLAQLKLLQGERDKALDALTASQMVGLEGYISFLAERDVTASRLLEPWVWGHPEGIGVGAGGLEGDWRFDQLASGGGNFAGVP